MWLSHQKYIDLGLGIILSYLRLIGLGIILGYLRLIGLGIILGYLRVIGLGIIIGYVRLVGLGIILGYLRVIGLGIILGYLRLIVALKESSLKIEFLWKRYSLAFGLVPRMRWFFKHHHKVGCLATLALVSVSLFFVLSLKLRQKKLECLSAANILSDVYTANKQYITFAITGSGDLKR
jgi:hypothetical protein